MALDLPSHLVELAEHVRKEGVFETRRLNFNLAQHAVCDLCRGLTAPARGDRAVLTGEALEDLARAFGYGEIFPRDTAASWEGMRWNPVNPVSEDLSVLQIPCPKCSAWELVAQGTRYPLVAHCRACGETSELK